MAWSASNQAQAQWNPALMAMQDINSSSYTPEQWALMQQQNWQQWTQWQQQYSQWQNQYGDKYAQQLHAVQNIGGIPPLPPSGSAPPPPPDEPPPPPPHENNQPLFSKDKSPALNTTPQQRSNSNYNTNSGTGNNQWSYSTDKQQQSAVNVEDLKKLVEEERLFDIQFQKWEEEIDKWRQENVNHPDKQAYKDYEAKFEACRKQLLERRQQMKLKRANLLNNPAQNNITGNNTSIAQPPPPKNSNQNSYSQKPPLQNSQNNSHERQYNQYNESSQFSNKRNNKNVEPQDRFESYDQNVSKNNTYSSQENDPQLGNESDKSSFLPTPSSSKGIPGLDLVPDSLHASKKQEVIDLSDDHPDGKAPDYSTISVGINNILGDEKIMNILRGLKPTQELESENVNAIPNTLSHDNSQFPRNNQGNRNQNFSQPQQYGERKNNMPTNRQGQFSQQNQIITQFQPPIQSGNYNQQNVQQDNYFDQNNQYRGPNNGGPNMSGGPGEFRGPGGPGGFRGPGGPGGPRGTGPSGPRGPGMQQGGPGMQQGGPSMRQSGPGMHQGGPGMRPSGPGMHHTGPGIMSSGPGMQQVGPGVRPGGPAMQQGKPGMRPNGPNMQQGGPNMQQGGSNMQHGGQNMQQGGPNMQQGGSNMQHGGQNMQQGGPNRQHGGQNIQQGGPNMQQSSPNIQHGGQHMQQSGPNMQQSGPNRQHVGQNIQQGGPNMQQSSPNIQHAGQNIQGGPNTQQSGTNMQHVGQNMQQSGHNMQQPQPLMANRISMPLQTNNALGRPPLQDMSSQQNTEYYGGPQTSMSAPQPKPKWVEDPLFTPSIVVEYEHKSLRLKARDFIEPVHTFDYNHISKDDEFKNKNFEHEADELFTRKPRRSERDCAEDRLRDLGNRDLYQRDYERRGTRDDFREMPRDIREIRGESRDMREPRDLREPRDMRELRDMRDNREPRDIRDTREPRDFRDMREPIPFREMDIRVKDDLISRDRSRDGTRDDYERRRDDRNDERRRDDRDRYGNKRVVGDDHRDRDRDFNRDRKDGRREDSRDNRRDDIRVRSTSRDKDSRKRGLSRESEVSNNSKKSKDAPQNKPIVMIDDLLEPPGRSMRPEKIVIILRGLPGSGKSYLAKLIRDREAEHGGTARIMSIDDYFMQEGEIEEKDPTTGKIVKKPSLKYEYDAGSEETYINSLKRAFKRSLTDGYFSFLIYDAVNSSLRSYADIWNFARQNGFQVYICTMEQDVQSCFKRNIHNRTLEDIEVLAGRFFPTPAHHIQLDATTLLQNAAITDVQMEDVNDEVVMEDIQEAEVESVFTSKWEKMDDASKLARLDGTSKPLRSSQLSMEEYLQLDDWTPNVAKPGKKTVRWADIEERRQQEKMRAIGFVVGQTDWNRMTDPTMGSSALTQTKYIERNRRN